MNFGPLLLVSQVSPLLSQYWDGPARRSRSAISYIVLKFHILGRRVGIQISVVYLPSVPVYGIWHFRYITEWDMTPGTCIPTLRPSIWKFELPLHSSLTSCVCDSSCWQINYRQLPSWILRYRYLRIQISWRKSNTTRKYPVHKM